MIGYMDEIRRALPAATLADMNLEQEMLLQYQVVREIQTNLLQGKYLGEEIAPNHLAQIANTVGNTLSKLGELQMQIYSSERFKRVELLLIKAMRLAPEEVAQSFLKDYENLLKYSLK